MTQPKINPTTKTAMVVWDDTNKVYKVWGGDISVAGSLITTDYDYIAVTYPVGTTEVYTFKTGGSGGTTVATVTIVYTDATKTVLSTVTKV